MKKKVWVTRDEDNTAAVVVWMTKPKHIIYDQWAGGRWFAEQNSDNWPFGNRKFGLKPGGIKQMTLEITLTDG